MIKVLVDDSDTEQTLRAGADEPPATEAESATTLKIPEVITRGHSLPAAYEKYVYTHTINPRTRTPKSGHLKDRALFESIERLPRWEQMQELIP
jgi:hypothetical protein